MLYTAQKNGRIHFIKSDSDNQDSDYFITNKYKSTYLCFVTIKPNNEDGHYIYLSSYGQQASDLLDKYTENKIEDNEELFSELDRFVQEAKSTIGYSKYITLENDCIYVSTFQNGIGISPEDEAGAKRWSARGRRRRVKPISIISAELSDGMDMDMDSEEEFDLNEEIEDADLDTDE